MSDDIVARLRDWSITSHTLEQEAADEIERLRAELAAKDRTLGENIRQTLLEQKRAEAAEAELDELRALLREALDYIDDPYNDLAVAIGAALKGDRDE